MNSTRERDLGNIKRIPSRLHGGRVRRQKVRKGCFLYFLSVNSFISQPADTSNTSGNHWKEIKKQKRER